MRFKVARTSTEDGFDTQKPCDGAKLVPIEAGHNWNVTAWVIELNSLEELIEFVDAHSKVVMFDVGLLGYHELEIYDKPRE